MSKKAATKDEKAHMGRVAALGCAICRMLGLGETPALVHHPRTGTGAGRRASHYDTIPLCPHHHDHTNESLHGLGRKAFEALFGITELELVRQTRALLGLAP